MKREALENLLQDYLDGNLNEEQTQRIENALAGSETLRNRLEILKIIENSLHQDELLQPSSQFTQKVMSNLHQVPVAPMMTPRNGLILLVGVLVVIVASASLIDTGIFNALNGLLTFDQLTLPSGIATPSLPAIPFSGKWVVNTIIALNLGLAFLILDKTILKPFFKGRRMQY